ncbi:MAG: hypothetical protein ACRC2K_13360 [Clostridium sp.]
MSKINLLDPIIYIPNFLFIRNKESELVKLKPNKPQKKLRDMINKLRAEGKPVRIIILKARQMGFSTYTEADCLHQTVTNKLFSSTIIAHEEQASQNLYNMFKTYYENLPDALRPMRKRNNSKELLFENPTNDDFEKKKNPGLKSSVKIATAKNTATGRSQTINYLHASEVAFWEKPEETFTGLLQCVPRTAKSTVIMESTANGIGDYFYNAWQRACNGESDFVPLFFAWYELDEYQIPFDTIEDKNEFEKQVNYTYIDEEGVEIHTEEWELMNLYGVTLEQLKWRKWCINNNCGGDIEKFHQEYPSNAEEAFIASGRPRFSIPVLRQYQRACTQGRVGRFETSGNSCIFVDDPNGPLELFKEPKDNEFYVIGADTAEGLITGDYSVGIALDNNFDICMKYRTHIDPDLFGRELVKMAKFYNNAYLGVENNNHGLTTLKAIQQEEYFNIYYTKSYDKISDQISQKMGFSTNNKTKPMLIDKLAEFIRNKWLGIKDRTIIGELFTYVIDEKGATNAQDGCFDDCVMALGIALQLLLEGRGENYRPYVVENSGKPQTYKNSLGFILGRDEDDDEDSPSSNKVEIAK